MLERIKGRAENDGKSVTVVDGVSLVDDVPVFSLANGRISQTV